MLLTRYGADVAVATVNHLKWSIKKEVTSLRHRRAIQKIAHCITNSPIKQQTQSVTQINEKKSRSVSLYHV